MPTIINESTIESDAIASLQQLGWEYIDGREIVPDGAFPWRERLDDGVLRPVLREAVARLNPFLPDGAVDEVVAKVCATDAAALPERNHLFYGWLTGGVLVAFRDGHEEKHVLARLLDFDAVENNRFSVVNQFTIRGNKGNRRPDMVCFVNGLPLVVFELKNPLREQADLRGAFQQLQTYQAEIADLFVFNQLLVISDGISARMGSLTADFDRFTAWRQVDESVHQRLPMDHELSALLHGLMPPAVLLDYVRHFVVFEQDAAVTIKKIAAYHQFYAVNEALQRTLSAYEQGDGKIGVVWHTQGSGKSLSMLFYAGKVLSHPALRNPTLLVVTDRNDLDGQLFATFSNGEDLLNCTPVQADSREDLRHALARREVGGVIFTTIQKFGLQDDEDVHPVLNTRSNIVVISDEAHRSQYGFQQKINAQGQYRSGYAQHLRHALPNAAFIGFTGTPVELEDRDTRGVFGDYVSIYDIQDAVDDGATVPIVYEARQIRLRESADFQAAMREAEALQDERDKDGSLLSQLMGTDERLEELAADFVRHFEQRVSVSDGKAMLVAASRPICVKLYHKIIALRPEWHSDALDQGAIKIIMSGAANDPSDMQPHLYSKMQQKALAARFKNPDDDLKIVIVCDMWLTGFDAPCCHTMYIDKPMKGHNLMQAIARVNRVFRNKSRDSGGLVVDYIGLTDDLREATDRYTRAQGKGEVAEDIRAVLNKMHEWLDIIRGQFATLADGKRFDVQEALALSEPQALLRAILRAANHILALDRNAETPSKPNADKTPRKNAFLQAVRHAKKGYALCGALPEIEPYQQELAFYDAVRATIVKNSSDGEKPVFDAEKQLKLIHLLNRAVASEGVVDLFDLTRQQRPNIGILSDEFLQRMRESDTPDLWASAIERYLKGEIRDKTAHNITERKNFETRLKEALNRYHNHNLSVIDIIEELIRISHELNAALLRGEQLGLNDAELAFYDALSQNDSAVELMGNAILKALAQDITQKLRSKVTLDWQHKPSVRAEMVILVKRALRRYKYPPDKQEEAVARILKQAEVLADAWSSAE